MSGPALRDLLIEEARVFVDRVPLLDVRTAMATLASRLLPSDVGSTVNALASQIT